jgi:hypothetical protein
MDMNLSIILSKIQVLTKLKRLLEIFQDNAERISPFSPYSLIF